MARRKLTPDDDSTAPSFEAALAGLETIVEAMEHEQLPLEELVAYYEQGSALLDRCEALLHSARERVELITLRQQNEGAGVAADSSAPSSPAPTPLDSTDDDDIRLF